MITKTQRYILTLFLGVVILGCYSNTSSDSTKGSSVNKSPFPLPESTNGMKTAGTFDGPMTLHQVSLTSEEEQKSRSGIP